MFRRSAAYYDAVYALKDYAAESARVVELIRARNPQARSLLDVACGTGKHMEHLREEFDCQGIDLDPSLLEIARYRLPDVPLHTGDMRSFDLGKTFDAVTCLFSAIGYVQGVEELRDAAGAMARHLAPGGVLVVEPWFSPETWQPGFLAARFVDEPDLKIARMNVSRTPDPDGRLVLDFDYLVMTPDGVEHFTEEHVTTLFTREQYVGSFTAAGIDTVFEPDGLLPGRGLLIGVKPA